MGNRRWAIGDVARFGPKGDRCSQDYHVVIMAELPVGFEMRGPMRTEEDYR